MNACRYSLLSFEAPEPAGHLIQCQSQAVLPWAAAPQAQWTVLPPQAAAAPSQSTCKNITSMYLGVPLPAGEVSLETPSHWRWQYSLLRWQPHTCSSQTSGSYSQGVQWKPWWHFPCVTCWTIPSRCVKLTFEGVNWHVKLQKSLLETWVLENPDFASTLK